MSSRGLGSMSDAATGPAGPFRQTHAMGLPERRGASAGQRGRGTHRTWTASPWRGFGCDAYVVPPTVCMHSRLRAHSRSSISIRGHNEATTRSEHPRMSR